MVGPLLISTNKSVYKRLRDICDKFLENGLVPVHENCHTYGGMSFEHTLRLLDEVPGLKLVYDTGNPPLTPDFRRPFSLSAPGFLGILRACQRPYRPRTYQRWYMGQRVRG